MPIGPISTHIALGIFLPTAKAMTRMMGVPDYESVVAQHPLSSLTDEECDERAANIADKVERILLGVNAAPVA